MKEEKITIDITEEKTNEITKALAGLNVFQWNQIKSAVDFYFSIRKTNSNDVIDVLLQEAPEGRNVYGREDEPGVVVFRDTVTDDICGLTIYGFSDYPEICKQSLIDLGFESIIDLLNKY